MPQIYVEDDLHRKLTILKGITLARSYDEALRELFERSDLDLPDSREEASEIAMERMAEAIED